MPGVACRRGNFIYDITYLIEITLSMNQPVNKLSPLGSTASHTISNQHEILQLISEPDVNLSLWRRQPQPEIARELQDLHAVQLPDTRRESSAESFDEDVHDYLLSHGLAPDAFTHLRADMRLLADHFFRASGRDVLKFRLYTTRGNKCSKFHVDTRQLRLLCTYQGPGTEWLEESQVDRMALAKGAPNELVIRHGEPSRFEPFWVGIFKGDPLFNWQGLVHRSPPISGSGQTRVIFCLDADPSGECAGLHSIK